LQQLKFTAIETTKEKEFDKMLLSNDRLIDLLYNQAMAFNKMVENTGDTATKKSYYKNCLKVIWNKSLT
jgi:hypothetical protein